MKRRKTEKEIKIYFYQLTSYSSAPSGKSKRARVYQTDGVTYKVEWKPVEAGMN